MRESKARDDSRFSILSDYITAYAGWDWKIKQYLIGSCGITLTGFWTLSLLLSEGENDIRSIAKRLDLNYTTVAETVSAMCRDGLINKSSNGADGRMTVASATEEGVRLFLSSDLKLAKLVADIWSPCDTLIRRRAFNRYHVSLDKIRKTRMTGDMVRGDSTFIIMCTELEMGIRAACQEEFLNLLQTRVLIVVAQEEHLDQKKLAGFLCTDPPSISKAVRALTEKNLLIRTEGPTGREVTLQATPSGSETAHRLMQRLFQIIDERLDIQSSFASEIATMLCRRLRQSNQRA